tara:strand:+ start:588 stop:818 length:231 start_codon:yes stop_codon:yes gene_type:complete
MEDSVMDEVKELRNQLLNRIELLEDDVERLIQENMDYQKELYLVERNLNERIDILTVELSKQPLKYEGQKGSETNY